MTSVGDMPDVNEILALIEETPLTDEQKDEIIKNQFAALEGGILLPEFSLKEIHGGKKEANGEVSVKSPYRVWPVDVTETRLKDQTSIVMDAIADINDPPFLFQRSRELVRMNYNEQGTPIIESLNESSLRGIVERCCDFTLTTGGGINTKTSPVPPPKVVMLDILNLPSWGSVLPLIGIIESPTIVVDKTDKLSPKYCAGGRLICEQGYDKDTGLYYAPPKGFVSPTIPEIPSEKNVSDAVALLEEFLTDFPFVDDASKENTIAALITIVIRPTIMGHVPMYLINKNMAGTGAGLLSDCISVIALGKSASIMTAPTTPEEWSKKLFATILTGRTLAVIDNLSDKLHSPQLSAVITADVYEERMLGKSKMLSLPHRMVWMANGINVRLGGDLARRCYCSNMVATTARPWTRDAKEFTHPELMQWVTANRTRLLGAILTLTRNWIIKGCKEPSSGIPKVGGFEGWRNVIGGIMEASGFKNFLGNIEAMYNESDIDTNEWAVFFERWYEKWGSEPQTTTAIAEYMKMCGNPINEMYAEARKIFD
jgi:hypothetical protein